jgi:hypothetical protein
MDVSELASQMKSLRDLDKLVIVDQVGRPVIRFGWSVALFFMQGETLEKRLAANNVLRNFLKSFGGHIMHFHPPDASGLKRSATLMSQRFAMKMRLK